MTQMFDLIFDFHIHHSLIRLVLLLYSAACMINQKPSVVS